MAYFAVCIFLSAFLLFQIEPMVGKVLLPWFGGTPAVWSTVLLFFQVLLTGGYAYASWLTSKNRHREVFHLILLGLSIALMLSFSVAWKSPIMLAAGLKPGAASPPVWDIFKLLAITVGLPFFLLAANSPLIQTWFHRAFPDRVVYRLYALSNAGSLFALVSYPVVIEPYLTLPWQGWIWSLGYVLFTGLAVFGVVKSRRIRLTAETEEVPGKMTGIARRPSGGEIAAWIGLSACASILLLATTSHLTQEVAVVPFLWVLPLTIYLLSFILAFSGERWYSRQVYLLLFFAATLAYAWALSHEAMGIPWKVGIFSIVLFFGCMVCHGEVYRLRPHPDHLAFFYLMVSVGGAIGGLLINFVAPYVFKGYWELPLGYVLCWFLFLCVAVRTQKIDRKGWKWIARNTINIVLLFSALVVTSERAVEFIQADFTDALGSWRNFYGVVRVRQFGSQESPDYFLGLIHGITLHGFEFQAQAKRDLPTAYYGPASGAGLAILDHPNRGHGMRVGVLGLGIGTLAAYGLPGDVYRFYEINPVVIRLAEGEGGYFSFLKDSQAKVEIVPGDARLSLENELAAGQNQHYDVLVLDVFSSDSIPVHLLDRESFSLYLQDLSPQGILAVHISNSYLDLVPVVWTLADHFNLSRVLIKDPGSPPDTSASIWMLLSPQSSVLDIPAIQSRATDMKGYRSGIRLWTDDYSNLFQILKH